MIRDGKVIKTADSKRIIKGVMQTPSEHNVIELDETKDEPSVATVVEVGSPSRKTYEYLNANTGGSVTTFNKYGAEGWRVIHTEKGWTLFERELA